MVMGYGSYHPYPRRFGGGKPALEVVHQSLNRQLGSAFDTSEGTVTSLQNECIARALVFDGQEVNERLRNQADPARMTDNLARWERIFKIAVPPGASDTARRAVVAARFRRFVLRSATYTRMKTALVEAIPDVFVGLDFISPENAVIHTSMINPNPRFPWFSTTAQLLVLLEKPDGWSEGQFYKAAGLVFTTLRPIKPTWMRVRWYRAPEGRPAVNVPGGPRAGGFYLDTPHTLDNSVFAR